jgi:hypothetical protein
VVRPVHAECSGHRGDYLGGADSRAGGSGAGLQARIAGLVEGSKVPRKPIGAAARVRKRVSSSSPVVGWQQLLRAAVSSAQRGRAEHLTEIGREGGPARCRTGRGGCGKERFGGKSRRGALAKSDITHGQARWDWCCGLDPEPLSSTATTAGLSWFGCARTPSTCSAVSHTCTATVVRDSVPRSRSLWIAGVLCGAPALCSTRAFPAAPVSPPHACCETALCL